MCTVGFGDISPKTDVEIFLCIITMIISCGVFAYCVKNIKFYYLSKLYYIFCYIIFSYLP